MIDIWKLRLKVRRNVEGIYRRSRVRRYVFVALELWDSGFKRFVSVISLSQVVVHLFRAVVQRIVEMIFIASMRMLFGWLYEYIPARLSRIMKTGICTDEPWRMILGVTRMRTFKNWRCSSK